MPRTPYNRLRRRLALSGLYLGVLGDIAELSRRPSGRNGVLRDRVTAGDIARDRAVNYLESRRFVITMWDGRVRLIHRGALNHFRADPDLWLAAAAEGYAHHERRRAR